MLKMEKIKHYDKLKFYNYVPVNKELKACCIACPDTEKYELELNEQLEEELKNVFQGNILDQINAKNINADLKRDLQKKINILSKRTDKAIIELIKRKINDNKNNQNIYNENEDDENACITLDLSKNNDAKLGHILHETLNKLDNMDESD
ncbi:pre-mRNA-splicing factor CWF18, putative [Plasmodium vinckei vinckei]|uniref:Pre-mRNA-splicing factor CWF18, putative n=1 Tax=Plasmodium vinckei vinckei TaxID=54757 RepID=A0A449BXY1_PLAVN|nr:pre-mRNA-splicing factor CWF18, putative [Plasmodium vinckei vinckei]VEV58231.1 pre-mRNA-splicing factor CWF18, putative [Plasmodium vinckei vinckei]